MIYSYDDLKGKIKVGDRVRAVPEKSNPCKQLKDDDSNERIITLVGHSGFSINDCWHSYSGDHYLDLNPTTETAPSWETLKPGDVVVDDIGDERKVIDVLQHSFLPSAINHDEADSWWFTFAEVIKLGWKIKGSEPEVPQTIEKDGWVYRRSHRLVEETEK